MKFASLCILGYKRLDMFQECMKSLHETIDFPCEIIVHFDGVEENPPYSMADLKVYAMYPKFSKYIITKGQNRGVGRSFENCLAIAEGDYIFKIDTDLIFKPKWLSTAVSVLENNLDIGAVSLFDYRHYNPEESRFNHIEQRNDCIIVDDFVSSIYGFHRKDLYEYDDGVLYPHKHVPDDGLHQQLGVYRGKLAITKEDMVINNGFGLGKSVYVVPDKDGNPVKATTYTSPKLFGI